MKKNLFLVVFCMTMCALLTGCKNTDYRKACEEHDFPRAYKIVQELDKYNGKEEAKRYVVLQEAMYVLEEHGEAGIMRISALIKENNAYWLPSELIDIVSLSNNNSLLECLKKLADMPGYSIRPESTSFKGVLKGYFEVVDEQYQFQDEQGETFNGNSFLQFDFTIRYIKPIPQKILTQCKKQNSGVFNLKLEYLNQNGLAEKYPGDNYTFFGELDLEVGTIKNLNIGETLVRRAYMSTAHLGKVKTFRVTSGF